MLPIFSANCHLIEPPHLFEGRLARKWADRAPRLVDDATGGQEWRFEDVAKPVARICAISGVPKAQWSLGSTRHEFMRPGCYDPVERLKDMDVDGVMVAACFSSPAGIGFNGDLFFHAKDPELGHAAMRAWNDWHLEEWVAAAPDRFVPVGCASYLDPEVGAQEVRRNAARGFKAVVFRNPPDLKLPWVGTGYWDPFLRACEETQTVIIHHTESLPWWPERDKRYPFPHGMGSTLFQSAAMDFLNSWLWGGVSVRFPKLRIMIAESGGSWIPHLLRRIEWELEYSPLHGGGWPDQSLTAVDMIRRTFVFSTLEVDQAVELQAKFGIGGWMIEDDYPHAESVWPETASHFGAMFEDLDPTLVEELAWKNAASLFRHPMPQRYLPAQRDLQNA